jgi:hypothetical protein
METSGQLVGMDGQGGDRARKVAISSWERLGACDWRVTLKDRDGGISSCDDIPDFMAGLEAFHQDWLGKMLPEPPIRMVAHKRAWLGFWSWVLRMKLLLGDVVTLKDTAPAVEECYNLLKLREVITGWSPGVSRAPPAFRWARYDRVPEGYSSSFEQGVEEIKLQLWLTLTPAGDCWEKLGRDGSEVWTPGTLKVSRRVPDWRQRMEVQRKEMVSRLGVRRDRTMMECPPLHKAALTSSLRSLDEIRQGSKSPPEDHLFHGPPGCWVWNGNKRLSPLSHPTREREEHECHIEVYRWLTDDGANLTRDKLKDWECGASDPSLDGEGDGDTNIHSSLADSEDEMDMDLEDGDGVPPRAAALRPAAPRPTAPRHATPRHATPRHAAPRHAAPRHAPGRPAAARPATRPDEEQLRTLQRARWDEEVAGREADRMEAMARETIRLRQEVSRLREEVRVKGEGVRADVKEE